MNGSDSTAKRINQVALGGQPTASSSTEKKPSIMLNGPPSVDDKESILLQATYNPFYTKRPSTEEINRGLDTHELLTAAKPSALKAMFKNSLIRYGALTLAAGFGLTFAGVVFSPLSPLFALSVPMMGIGIALILFGGWKEYCSADHTITKGQILGEQPEINATQTIDGEHLRKAIKINVEAPPSESQSDFQKMPIVQNMPPNIGRDMPRLGQVEVFLNTQVDVPRTGFYKSPFAIEHAEQTSTEHENIPIEQLPPILEQMEKLLGKEGAWRVATLLDPSTMLSPGFTEILSKNILLNKNPEAKGGAYFTIEVDDQKSVTITAKSLYALNHTAGEKQDQWDECFFAKQMITIPWDDLQAEKFAENPFPGMQVIETISENHAIKSNDLAELARLEHEFNLF